MYIEDKKMIIMTGETHFTWNGSELWNVLLEMLS